MGRDTKGHKSGSREQRSRRERRGAPDFEGLLIRIIEQLEAEGLGDHLRGQVKPVLLAQLPIGEARYVLYVHSRAHERRLSPKQDRLARLLARGVGEKQAAMELGMALHTVKEQKRRIFDRLGIHSMRELRLHFAPGPGSSDGPSTASPQPRKTLREIQSRAQGLLAKLLEGPAAALGDRGALARPPSRPRTTPLADVLRDGWRYLLRAFWRPGWCRLTPREWEVACLAACGIASKEIADALSISWHTVSAHLTPALNKLGAASREDLPARLAARTRGLGAAKN